MTEFETYDLAATVALANRAIETRGSDWIHRNDPNRPMDAHSTDCYNAFRIDAPFGESEYVPGCIAGQMIVDSGAATAEWLVNNAHSDDFRTVTRDISDSEVSNVRFTEAAKSFTNYLQSEQDRGNTWGDSLARALTYIVSRDRDEFQFTPEELAWVRERQV